MRENYLIYICVVLPTPENGNLPIHGISISRVYRR